VVSGQCNHQQVARLVRTTRYSSVVDQQPHQWTYAEGSGYTCRQVIFKVLSSLYTTSTIERSRGVHDSALYIVVAARPSGVGAHSYADDTQLYQGYRRVFRCTASAQQHPSLDQPGIVYRTGSVSGADTAGLLQLCSCRTVCIAAP